MCFNSHCSILLFPPLNSYRRFLIHKVCENYPDFGTVSVSQGDGRRVIIYSRGRTSCNIPSDLANEKEEKTQKLVN